ncbi:MAG: aromatic acid exporter family protein [Treponema sp.]|nr:aromatic acid exporter family protein [Treponema sp.]
MIKFPPIGMRMIKTSLSVILCLLLGYWFHYPTPLYACMAAVIVTREDFTSSFQQGIARILATVVGCLFALIIMHFNIENVYLNILIIGAGCILTIYFCVLIKHPDAAALSAIIFLSLTMVHIEDKYLFTLIRFSETVAGIIIAIAVNVLWKKKPDTGASKE